jgi:hypothetical protein
MPTIPTREPLTLIAGDSVTWKRTNLSDYPAPTWTLTYEARAPITNGSILLTATQDGSTTHFLISANAATTAPYAPGVYAWAAYVTSAGDRYQVGVGTWEVRPNLAAQPAGYDGRTYARKMLDDIEAAQLLQAGNTLESSTVQQRTMARMSKHDLRAEWAVWRSRVNDEENAARIARGETPNTLIRVTL